MAKALKSHNGVEAVERQGSNVLRVNRRHGHPTVDILTVDIDELDGNDVTALLSDHPGISGIVNVRREAIYTGAAKARAQQLGVGLFTLKELMGAAGASDFSGYERSSIEYAKRVLPQHSKVLRVEHLDQERLLVVRDQLPDVRFVTADIYILGIADVRDLLSKYPAIDAIVKTNPNGEYSDEAQVAARTAGVGLFTFREFMGALNHDGERFLDYDS